MKTEEISKLKEQLQVLRKKALTQVKRHSNTYERELGDDGDRAAIIEGCDIDDAIASVEDLSLIEITDALKRIDENKFGFCESCEKKILLKRLRATPYVRYCLDCQQERENLSKIPS